MRITRIHNRQGLMIMIMTCITVCIMSVTCLSANEKLPDIKPKADLDENLFLVRVLESLYEQWPSDVSQPDKFVAAAVELRKKAIRFKEYIRQDEKRDKELADRFDDFISALDSYTDFLANINIIEAKAERQLNKDSFASGFKSGLAGGETFCTLSQSEDISSGDAAVASIIVGGLTYAIDAWDKANQRDIAKKKAIESEAKRIGDKIQAFLLQAQTTARLLAKKHGWSDSEIGWELSDEHAKLFAKLVEAGDLPALIKITERQCLLRPRDPILRLNFNFLCAMLPDNSSDALSKYARDCYAAASLVPENSIYDEYRIACVYFAAELASKSRHFEFQKGQAVTGSSKNGQLAVALWRKVLELSPSDPGGEIRESLGFALMSSNSLSEALQYADDVMSLRKDTPAFCYNYACLMSRLKQPEKALQWLESSIKCGNYNIAWAKADPDLESVRNSHAKQFAELLTPKWSWYVTDDWLWDDVVLKNDSLFPLSNIKLSVTLKKGGYQETLTLNCDYLGPGEKMTWGDIVNGCEGTWDKESNATLSCDQK